MSNPTADRPAGPTTESPLPPTQHSHLNRKLATAFLAAALGASCLCAANVASAAPSASSTGVTAAVDAVHVKKTPVKSRVKAVSKAKAKTAAKASSSAAVPVALSPLAQVIFDRLNGDRAAAGLGALVADARLTAAAGAHNSAMATSNTMSHQLPGEAALPGRIQARGYKWRLAGENVGWSTDQSVGGVLHLDDLMMAEVAPNNGHRLNILNAGYTQVGISVFVYAPTGKLWLTEDFGRPQ